MKLWIEAVLRSLAVALLGVVLCAPGRWGETQSGGGSPGGAAVYSRTTLTANATTTDAVGFTSLSQLNWPVLANTNYLMWCHLRTTTNGLFSDAIRFQVQGPGLTPTRIMKTRYWCSNAALPNNFANDIAFDVADDGIGGGPSSTFICSDRIAMTLFSSPTPGTITFNFRTETAGVLATVFAGSYCERAVVP